MWSCDTEAVAHVTSTGLVTSVAEGKSQVVASDKKNAAHFDKAEVHVHGCALLLCIVVCLTLLASFFLPSYLSLNMYKLTLTVHVADC